MLSCSMNNVILDVFEQDEGRFFYPLRGQATARDFVKALHGRGIQYSDLCAEIGEAEQNFASWRKGLGRNGVGQRMMDRINEPLAQVLLSDDEEGDGDAKQKKKAKKVVAEKKKPMNSLEKVDLKAKSGDIIKSWIDQLDGKMGATEEDEEPEKDAEDNDDDWKTPPVEHRTQPNFSGTSVKTNGMDSNSSVVEPATKTTTTQKETVTASMKHITASKSVGSDRERTPPLSKEKEKTPPLNTEREKTPPTRETTLLTVQKEVNPRAVEKEVTPPPLQKEQTPPPVQKEVTPSPVQKEVTPPPVQKEVTPPPVQKEVTPPPPPFQKEVTLPLVQKEQTPPPVQKEATPPPTEREVSPPINDTLRAQTESKTSEVTTAIPAAKQTTDTTDDKTKTQGTNITKDNNEDTKAAAADTSDSESYPDTSDTDIDDDTSASSNHFQVALAALDRDLRAYGLPAAIRSSEHSKAILEAHSGYMYVLSDSGATAETHRTLVGVTERRLERLLDIAVVYNVDIALVGAVTLPKGQLAIASRELTNRLSERKLEGNAGWFVAPIAEILKCVGDIAIKYSSSSSSNA